MHTITFSRKTGTSRFSWRNILSVLVLFLCLSGSHSVLAQAASVSDNSITVTTKPTNATLQDGRIFTGADNNELYASSTPLGRSSNPSFAVPQLGTYDLNSNSTLTITAARLRGRLGSNNTTVVATRLQYRVYLTSIRVEDKPAYTNVPLTFSQNGNADTDPYAGSGSTDINLLTGLTSGGVYVIDVRFQVDLSRVDRNGITSTNTVSDLSGGDYYLANFSVTPPTVTPPGGVTTWVSTTAKGSTDWADLANWSNGVPTALSNAIIPAKTTNQIYPILNSPTQDYSVLNLTLDGSGSTAAQLSINTATLRVYGDLVQRGGGVAGALTGATGVANSALNSTIIFAGANQLITGQLSVSDIIIAGSGTKSIINSVNPTNIIALQPSSVTDGVIIQSAAYDISGNIVTSYTFDTSGNSFVELGPMATISNLAGQIETEKSYIRGVLKTTRTLTQNTKNTFGNIGLDVTANHTPGSIIVFRIVGEPLQGPARTTVPVKRRYRIEGDDNSGSNVTADSKIDVVFHYLPSADELNGIKEEDLTMFSTITNGAPYSPLFGTLDTDAHTVTRLDISSLPKITLTLGDRTNPLPVSLTAFTAVRSGTAAVLNWTTASEKNNTGFEVQVSADGATFRKLAFVATQNANSSQKLLYAYTDTENGKTGVRYYRLRQIDTDETDSFSPVRAVSFSGTALAATALAGYPNPFTNKLDFNLDATVLGNGVAHIQLVDMTGRIVREQDLKVANASLTLNDLDGLRSGLYLAKVTLPDGTTQKVRVQKQ